MAKTLREIDKALFVKHYNNEKLSNDALVNKLDTTWSTISVLASSKYPKVFAELTMLRSKAAGQNVARPLTAEELAARNGSTATASSSAAVAASSNGQISIQLIVQDDNKTELANEKLTARSGEELDNLLKERLRALRMTKVNLFRSGEFVHTSDIRNGDTILARIQLEAA